MMPDREWLPVPEQDVPQLVRHDMREHCGLRVEPATGSPAHASDQLADSMVEHVGDRSEPLIPGGHGVTERFPGHGHS